ncbi:MAG: hypothetical protein K0S55_499, partial [Clostridia bacterium]|nr:hypothetical protein [Clostridia bacterium]
IFFIKFPPKNAPSNMKEASPVFTLLERAGQAGCFISLIISKDYFRIDNINIYLFLMLICIIFYYGLWIRYIIKGCDFYLLWKPFLFIPIPLAVFPVSAFAFAALWGNCIWLGIAAIILAVGHITVSWNSYKQVKSTSR